MLRFEGKSVVITGASGDLGRAVAAAFAREGADLGLVYGRRRGPAEELARGLRREGRRVELSGCDLLASASEVAGRVRAAITELEHALGRVDGLVALAGLPATPALWQKAFDDVTAEELHAAYAVDTVGTFLFAQAVAPALRATRGSIVVMSSSAAFYGDTLGLVYAPAKSANAGLVRVLARVLAPEVRVNGVAPGGIESGWLATLSPEQRRHAGEQALLRRLGKPAEVADMILSLTAPGYLNGQILALDGGIFPHPAAG